MPWWECDDVIEPAVHLEAVCGMKRPPKRKRRVIL
jgi:hypothetical protein